MHSQKMTTEQMMDTIRQQQSDIAELQKAKTALIGVINSLRDQKTALNCELSALKQSMSDLKYKLYRSESNAKSAPKTVRKILSQI